MNLDCHKPLDGNSGEINQEKKVLVISGGGFRGAYALGILKALEGYGIKKDIDAIYGVSIGAVIGSLRAKGYSADYIFERLKSLSIKDFPIIKKSDKLGGLISTKKIKEMLDKLLPPDFESLKIPCYFGVVDNQKGEFILYNKGNLPDVVLGSMSMPVIFPPVKHEDKCLIDGGTLNNFPIVEAHQQYPNHKIIGIVLNKFKENQDIDTPIKSLMSLIDIVMDSQHQDAEKLALVTYLFRRELLIPILSLNKHKMDEAFKLGCEDGENMFGTGKSNK